jgi:L-seryl-tRNA(Ser) seleniumtransferase
MTDRPAPKTMSRDLQQRLQALPSVDVLLRHPEVAPLVESHGRVPVTRAIREVLAAARVSLLDGADATVNAQVIEKHLRAHQRPSLRPVINATGVVLHTNLGRAPLAQEALDAAVDVGRGYSNLEFNLETGERGSRHDHVRALCRKLWGVEDALVVNNCAAAVLLALSSVAHGREAVVSRGELVEIGGGFRIPEVITQGGARLREVGTTNRTRVADYAAAVTPETAVFLKVHRSNFSVVGFTEEASLQELKALGASTHIPVLLDLGTGRMEGLHVPTPDEPTVAQAVKEGADLLMFSGDKLLGGPQAGFIVGRADLVERCRKHPLCRAVRVDKMTLAALMATLQLHLDGRAQDIPAVHMMNLPVPSLRARADALCSRLRAAGVPCATADVFSTPGGGTLPTTQIASVAVKLTPDALPAHALAAALRACDPPVVCRVEDATVLLDLRCVTPAQDATLLSSVLEVVGSTASLGRPV